MMNQFEKNKKNKTKTLGERIAACRKKNNWTQLELSIRAGITRDQISRIELGKSKPTIETIRKIEEAFNLPGWFLLDDQNETDEIDEIYRLRRDEILLRLQRELSQRNLSINELLIVECVALSTADALSSNLLNLYPSEKHQ